MSEVIARGYEDGAVVRLADGKVKDAVRRGRGPDFVALDQAINVAASPELARFLAAAERGANDHRKGATRKALKALTRVALPWLEQVANAPVTTGDAVTDLEARLAPRPFAPAFPSPGPAPALVLQCPENEERPKGSCAGLAR